MSRDLNQNRPIQGRTRRGAALGVVLAGVATAGLLLVGDASLLSANGAALEPPPGRGVRADAAGVNEGTKRQAPGIVLRPVDPAGTGSVLGQYGADGGCTPGYGKGRACLPPTSPAAAQMGMTSDEHAWTCADVRMLLPQGIRLDQRGTDPLRLDADGDGVACSAGD